MKQIDRDLAARQIEDAIDRGSLSEVFDILSDICYGKAEHIESAWQDRVTASAWVRMAKKIEKIDTKGL